MHVNVCFFFTFHYQIASAASFASPRIALDSTVDQACSKKGTNKQKYSIIQTTAAEASALGLCRDYRGE